jgi:hypothetical protein
MFSIGGCAKSNTPRNLREVLDDLRSRLRD